MLVAEFRASCFGLDMCDCTDIAIEPREWQYVVDRSGAERALDRTPGDDTMRSDVLQISVPLWREGTDYDAVCRECGDQFVVTGGKSGDPRRPYLAQEKHGTTFTMGKAGLTE